MGLIRGYRVLISLLCLPTCRLQPTCSQYALEAVEPGWLYGVEKNNASSFIV